MQSTLGGNLILLQVLMPLASLYLFSLLNNHPFQPKNKKKKVKAILKFEQHFLKWEAYILYFTIAWLTYVCTSLFPYNYMLYMILLH